MRFLRELQGPSDESDLIAPSSGLSGGEAAKKLLIHSGLKDKVDILCIFTGESKNDYDPKRRIIRFSSRVYFRKSLLSVALAAHEVAHVEQHLLGFRPFLIRFRLLPFAKFAAIAFGFLLFWAALTQRHAFSATALAGFGLLAVFHALTIWIEFDAARLASVNLWASNLINEAEEATVRRILRRAALTYLLAFALAPLNLFRILFARAEELRGNL